MPFDLMPLPFDSNALKPYMTSETLDFHHGKHHRAYVDKVNALVDEKGISTPSLAQIIRDAKAQRDMPLFNNAAQVWNHNFFWNSLTPAPIKPKDKLAALITDNFGSVDALTTRLAEEAGSHFGSGWVWLVMVSDSLVVTSLHDADTPVTYDYEPLLVLDVWEHAYYIDYRNSRPKYAATVLGQLINWDFVAQNLDGNGVARCDQSR
ncbi:MAG: superoxide dismutase [Alphaproteobacteria bacterium]|nr:MAG: superoxide dismutase [Alphaproteobacteria bacterium]